MAFGLGRKKSNKKKPTKKKEPTKKKAAVKEEKAATEAKKEDAIGEPSIEPVSASDAPVSARPSGTQPSTGQQSTAQAAAKMVTGPPPEEVYVDGISSLIFRPGVVKFDCYRVVGHDQQDNKEVRLGTHRLVMPQTALQDLIQLLQNASERQQAMAQGNASMEKAG